jgi:cytochrome c-type protein NapC
MAISKQKPMAQKLHEQARKCGGKMTCIDCHKGIAHNEPEEPAQPAEKTPEKAAVK